MKCEHCGKEINPAAMLGALGKGKRKPFSQAERKRRAQRLAIARQKRHKPKPSDQS